LKDEHEIGFARLEGEPVRRMRRPRSGRLPFFGLGSAREPSWSSRAPGGKVGNRFLVFHFSRRCTPERWEGWKTWVWFSTLSTDPAFPRPPWLRYRKGGSGDCILQCRSSRDLAAVICRAHSVSLIASAFRSSSARLRPGLRYCSACSSDFSFSNGVR